MKIKEKNINNNLAILPSHNKKLQIMEILLRRRKSSKRRPLTQDLMIYVASMVRKVIDV